MYYKFYNQSAIASMTWLILPKMLQDESYQHPHFTDEQTEAQRQKAAGLRPHSSWQSWVFLSPFLTVRGRIYNRCSSCLCHLITWGWTQVLGQDPEKVAAPCSPPAPTPLLSTRPRTLCLQASLKVASIFIPGLYFHKWALVLQRARFIFPSLEFIIIHNLSKPVS